MKNRGVKPCAQVTDRKITFFSLKLASSSDFPHNRYQFTYHKSQFPLVGKVRQFLKLRKVTWRCVTGYAILLKIHDHSQPPPMSAHAQKKIASHCKMCRVREIKHVCRLRALSIWMLQNNLKQRNDGKCSAW